MAGSRLVALPLTPVSEVEASTMSPVVRSLTYTSCSESVSPGSRLSANEPNATVRPLPDRSGKPLMKSPFVPPLEVEASVRDPEIAGG